MRSVVAMWLVMLLASHLGSVPDARAAEILLAQVVPVPKDPSAPRPIRIPIGISQPSSRSVVISSPLGTSLLERGGSYILSGADICAPSTTTTQLPPPRVRLDGIDVASSSVCLQPNAARFTVSSTAPLGIGSLTVSSGRIVANAGTFEIAPASGPQPMGGADSAPPVLSVSPATLTFDGVPLGSTHVPPDRQTLRIENAGGGTLAWTVSESHFWLWTAANEQCAVPSNCPACGMQCSGGTTAPASFSRSSSYSGTGPATVAVRAPGWELPSGGTHTGTITITSNGGTINVTVIRVTTPDVELRCGNATDDDGDGTTDSGDPDCAGNPFAGF